MKGMNEDQALRRHLMATPDKFAMRDLVGTTTVAVAENPQ